MANSEHLAILKQGAEAWNEWRNANPAVAPDLESADLRGWNLSGASLHRLNLERADLSQANLNNSVLNISSLYGANLGTASLVNSALMQVNLNSSNVDEADFTMSQFGFTSLGDVDLSKASNLEKVIHFAPSIIGVDTIFKSRGNIPEIFLRGCGVPESFIAYMHSLTGKTFEFYSCFISHSAQDKHFCERVYADLRAKGVRVWYFHEDAKWGEPVWGEIDRSIKLYDKLVVVCSANSLQSVPVQREIERALSREDKEHKSVLFPVRTDDYIFDKWEHQRKADVLAKVIGDFSGWDKDAAKYEKAFDKLLRGLQAESGRA